MYCNLFHVPAVDTVRQRAAAIAAAAAAAADAEARRDAEFEDPQEAQGAGTECSGQKLLPLEAWSSVPGGKDACHVLQPGEAEELSVSLLQACAQFQQGKGQFAQFRELDLAYRLSPQALVGREVGQVQLWPRCMPRVDFQQHYIGRSCACSGLLPGHQRLQPGPS